MKGSLKNSISVNLLVPFESVSEKIKGNGSTSRNKIFLEMLPLSNGNNSFKENLNERISSPLNRKSVACGYNKGFL